MTNTNCETQNISSIDFTVHISSRYVARSFGLTHEELLVTISEISAYDDGAQIDFEHDGTHVELTMAGLLRVANYLKRDDLHEMKLRLLDEMSAEQIKENRAAIQNVRERKLEMAARGLPH
ncbi:MAG: hypothetical protein K0R27_750 [Xanthobacteraceae bacterium]|jgi:phage regulator Rha-like protein|nr:hypothetical protein [Xanthobacteraceae bacterium]